MSPPAKRPSGEHQAPSGLSSIDNVPATGADLRMVYEAIKELRDTVTELKTVVDQNNARILETLPEHQDIICGTTIDNPGLQIRVERIEQKEKRVRGGIWLVWAAVGIVSAGVTIAHYWPRELGGEKTRDEAAVHAPTTGLLGRHEPAAHDND